MLVPAAATGAFESYRKKGETQIFLMSLPEQDPLIQPELATKETYAKEKMKDFGNRVWHSKKEVDNPNYNMTDLNVQLAGILNELRGVDGLGDAEVRVSINDPNAPCYLPGQACGLRLKRAYVTLRASGSLLKLLGGAPEAVGRRLVINSPILKHDTRV